TRLQLRPELVSYLLFAVVVRAVAATLANPEGPAGWRVWVDPRRAPGRATLATLVWAQVHGFAALVPLVWVLGLLGALADRRGRGAAVLARRAGAGFLLGLAALAATPNGLAGLALPVRALGQFGGDRPDLAGIIAELVPLLETRDSLGTTLVVFRASLVWSLLWVLSQGSRVPVLRVLLLVAGALAAWQAQRALGFYAVAFVLLHTGTRWPLRLPPGLRLPRRAAAAVAAAALVAVCAWWWPAIVGDRFYLGEGVARRFGHGLTPAHVPTGSLRTLRESGAATVVANVDAAGAVLAARGPAVFIDGRTEAYPPDLWRQYGQLRAGGDGARTVLDRHRPGAVLLAYGSGAFTGLARQLREDPAWTLSSVDGAAVLFLPAPVGPPADPRATAAALLARADAPGLSGARAADLCLAAARTSDLAGDRAAAAAALARGAALRPDHPLVQHNLGNALLAQERFAPALAAFAAAYAANGRQAGSALNAGVCALRLGRAEEARAWFGRAVGVDPERFEGWVNLAAALQQLGDREGARRALEKAVALRPGDARLRGRLRELATR
ncbi:MAG: tetratricopeptide repeat protein, partial [Candidatus Krumholzibacteriia bacterium]